MFGSILTNARTWALGGLLALGATAIDAGANSCVRVASGYACQLDATNSGGMTEMEVFVARFSPYMTDGTGTFYRDVDDDELIWFFGAGALHTLECTNGSTWGVVGAGLCSYWEYNAYPF